MLLWLKHVSLRDLEIVENSEHAISTSRSVIAFLRVSDFFSFLTNCFGFVDYLKILISSFTLICSSSASSSDKLLL